VLAADNLASLSKAAPKTLVSMCDFWEILDCLGDVLMESLFFGVDNFDCRGDTLMTLGEVLDLLGEVPDSRVKVVSTTLLEEEAPAELLWEDVLGDFFGEDSDTLADLPGVEDWTSMGSKTLGYPAVE